MNYYIQAVMSVHELPEYFQEVWPLTQSNDNAEGSEAVVAYYRTQIAVENKVHYWRQMLRHSSAPTKKQQRTLLQAIVRSSAVESATLLCDAVQGFQDCYLSDTYCDNLATCIMVLIKIKPDTSTPPPAAALAGILKYCTSNGGTRTPYVTQNLADAAAALARYLHVSPAFETKKPLMLANDLVHVCWPMRNKGPAKWSNELFVHLLQLTEYKLDAPIVEATNILGLHLRLEIFVTPNVELFKLLLFGGLSNLSPNDLVRLVLRHPIRGNPLLLHCTETSSEFRKAWIEEIEHSLCDMDNRAVHTAGFIDSPDSPMHKRVADLLSQDYTLEAGRVCPFESMFQARYGGKVY